MSESPLHDATGATGDVPGRILAVITSPSQAMNARSTTLRSSRTLPGHACDMRMLERGVVHPGDALVVLGVELLDEAGDEERDVLAPLAQRRHREGEDVEAVVEVLAERAPSFTAVTGSLLVAATTRTSTRDLGLAAEAAEGAAPRGRGGTWPGCRAASRRSRRGRGCRRGRARSSPRAGRGAPVKAPRSWPKSSLSSRVSGMAAQLTATKGPLARGGELVEGARDELLAGAGLAAG